MKLTEAKLKQMILEALKDSSFRNFGVPTPDEKLRSDLGGEMFDKIQGLDPEQRDIMKQTFDPNYPESIKQESLDAMLNEAGFKPYDNSWMAGPTKHKRYSHRMWHNGEVDAVGTTSVNVTYQISNGQLRYTIRAFTKTRYSKQGQSVARGNISIPPMFELSLKTDQGLRDADAIVLSKEKQAIEQFLEQYK